MTSDRQPADTYDVAILGGGLAGLTLGAADQAGAPGDQHLHRREARRPGAGGRLQGRRVDRRGLRATTSARSSALRTISRTSSSTSSGCASGSRRATTATSPSASSAASTRPARSPELPARPRPLRELPLASSIVEAGIDLFGGAPSQDVELGDDALHDHARRRGGEESTIKARWVVDAGGRAFILKKKLGLLEDNGHDVNAVVVPARRRARHRGLGRSRRRGVLRPHVRARPAQVQHQPPLRRGLLGLDDPAGLGPDLDRHRAPIPASTRGRR